MMDKRGGINIIDRKIRTEKAYKYASNGYKDITVDYYLTAADWGKTLLAFNVITVYLIDALPVGFWCVVRNKDGDLKTIAISGTRPLHSDGDTLPNQHHSCIAEVEPIDTDTGTTKWHCEGDLA